VYSEPFEGQCIEVDFGPSPLSYIFFYSPIKTSENSIKASVGSILILQTLLSGERRGPRFDIRSNKDNDYLV